MSTKKTNNLYKRPLTKKKPVSFANALKRNIPMKIEKIKLKDWLNHYNIDEKVSNIFTLHSDIKFLYNSDLLDYFYTESHFFDFVSSKLKNIYKKKKLEQNKNTISDFKDTLYKLVDAYHILYNQKFDYELYFSSFDEYTKKAYQEGLKYLKNKDVNYRNAIDSTGLNSNEIIKKLELLDVKKCMKMSKSQGLPYFLGNDYEVLKAYLRITNNAKSDFRYGLKENMTKKELRLFLINSTKLKQLEICENKFKLDDIINKLLIMNSSQLLNMDFEDLIYEMVSHDDCDNIKLKKLSRIISALFFPDKSKRYIDNHYRKLLQIPTIKQNLNRSKIRVFLIAGHGPCYTPETYSSLPKINLKSVINKNNIKLLSSQPYGRLASTYLPTLLAKILNDENGKLVSKALWCSESKKDFNILENLLNFLFFNYQDNRYTPWDENSTEVKYEKWKKSQTSFHNKHYKLTDNESESYKSTIFDFVKYNYLNPPKNTQISFMVNQSTEEMKGIIEITENTNETLNYMGLINRHNSKNNRHKMGLGLDQIYGTDSGLISNKSHEITKYNKYLEWKYGKLENGITLNISDIIDAIYNIGNIQRNDKVLILMNQCRGVSYHERKAEWNTIKNLSPIKRKAAYKLRVKSQEESYSAVI